MHKSLLSLMIFCTLMMFSRPQAAPQSEFRGEYLGQKTPGYKPEAFAPNIFSAWNNYGFHLQSSISLSPTGTELYFTDQTLPAVEGRSRSIMFMRRIDDTWTEPGRVPFSSDYSDWGLFCSEDGSVIYFFSTRPLHKRGAPKDADVWFVEKSENGWSEPAQLDYPINTAYDEISGTMAGDGVIFFSSNRPGGKGGFDIYFTRIEDGAYGEPMNLGESVNTTAEERVLYVAPDLGFVIFYRLDVTEKANAGLYVTYKHGNAWTAAKSIGDHINMLYAKGASLSPDGEYLFFLGEGYGMYWLNSEVIQYLRNADLNISERLLEILSEDGLKAACSTYSDLKKKHAKYVEFNEFLLNQKGYQYLRVNDVARAVGIFRICVALFPDSWNAYDSLGEAYLAAGESDKAKVNYRRSLELNPRNGNAIEKLKELKKK